MSSNDSGTAATCDKFFKIPDGTPRFCAEGHSMIQWFNPAIVKCPLCDITADLKKVSSELERAKDELGTHFL